MVAFSRQSVEQLRKLGKKWNVIAEEFGISTRHLRRKCRAWGLTGFSRFTDAQLDASVNGILDNVPPGIGIDDDGLVSFLLCKVCSVFMFA